MARAGRAPPLEPGRWHRYTWTAPGCVGCSFMSILRGWARASARPALAPCAASGVKRIVAPSLPPVLDLTS